MKLNIKYFGLLAEVTHRSEEVYDFSQETIGDLINDLIEKYPELKSKDFQVAHALKIAEKDTKITESEIALLPPFSGG